MELLFSDALEISPAARGGYPTVKAFLTSIQQRNMTSTRGTRPKACLAKTQDRLLAIDNFTQMNRGRLSLTNLARTTHPTTIYMVNCV
jgi:hypothetical protein